MEKLSNSFGKKLLPVASAGIFLFAASGALAQTNAPSLKIVTPGEAQTIYGDKVPILLAVENFQIVDYQTKKVPALGEGHVHLWLDDKNSTKESAVKVTGDEFTFSDVPAGDHSLRAELVNNDHSSQIPPQVVTVNFKSAPVTTPSPAAASGFDRNTAVVIFVVVALVIAAAWWYTKEEDEEETPKSETKPKPKRKAQAKKKTSRSKKRR
ncbi:hypothetical protein A3D81_01840 [Candidatus Curtissbacteria bacterium RIFCSPHIGHO2_02_FULL_40_17]|uniref:DUF4399 domain-containing protein n=2 Tax=Candidatus Curtissiibacteriota TaxID=1752717 RepID=A0A1F5GGA5_9BACT|nr:MAG: hypothetical protein A3D81_01840 [Candidatus Curtissbacteria bacterium RIFCSPHIGHO2_02_FULL_40_17]OGE05751.1 MAG: hypothetical protein A3F45_04060 [Candidatus Curtissbacteria bacterium RIFCSPHIGHO2_12_FULL_41_17]